MTPQAAHPDHGRPATTNTHPLPAGIDVDGRRPAVAAVTALPRAYRLTTAERIVLLSLACDSFDGVTSAPGYAALAHWTGLSQGVLTKSLRSLSEPTAHRPALLSKTSTRGRVATEWTLTLQPVASADRFRAEQSYPQPVGDADPFELIEPVGEPVGQPVGEPVGSADDPLPLPSPGGTTPKDVTTERAHENDARARSALERITRERRLPVSAAELLPHAYRLGHGDPWEGYREVKTRTEATLDSARDPRRALLSRLTAPPPEPRAPRAPAGPCQHVYDAVSGYCQRCAEREDVAS